MKSLALLVCLIAVSQGFEYMNAGELKAEGKSCSPVSPPPIFVVSDFTVTPKPRIHEFVLFVITGTASEDETVPTLNLNLKRDGIAYYKEAFNVNAKFEANDTGNVSIQIYIPGNIVPGDYSAQLKLMNEDQEELCCWEYDFSI